MKLREIMRPRPWTIAETDTLGGAHRTMMRNRIRHLPVTSGGRLVGLLSERDVLAARARSDGEEWWRHRVHDAMSAPAHTANADDSLTEAAARMAMGKIGALPIVELGKLIGIVTVSDVLDAEVRRAMGPTPAATATAADVMTAFPWAVRDDTPLLEAVAMMTDRHVRHLPVVDRGAAIVGMLSESDVRTAVGDPMHYLEMRGNGGLATSDVMTSPAITVEFDRSLLELARLFTDKRIGAVPVVDKFGALIGIVSYVDALRVLAG